MIKREVAPLIKALIENRIDVAAVRNHIVYEEPKVFFCIIGVWECRKAYKRIKDGANENRYDSRTLIA